MSKDAYIEIKLTDLKRVVELAEAHGLVKTIDVIIERGGNKPTIEFMATWDGSTLATIEGK